MKKMLSIAVLGIFIITMFSSMVSAAGVGDQIAEIVNGGLDAVFEIAKPLLDIIVGETASTGDFLSKILIWIIVLSLVWMALNNIDFFTSKPFALWTVAIAVSILSIRWIGEADILASIILPYSALGIFISAGLPFALAFVIIEKSLSRVARKLAWIFFAIIFAALWIVRRDEALEFAYVYLITAGVAILAMLMDGTIQRYFRRMKIERSLSPRKRKLLETLRDELESRTKRFGELGETYDSVYKNGKTGEEGYKADMANINRRISAISKDL